MVKKSTAADIVATDANTLTGTVLSPETGEQLASVEQAVTPAPAPADAPEPVTFVDDAGDASADDPLPFPATAPAQGEAGIAASGVGLWRKVPVVIEAIQYTGNNLADVFAFTGKHPKWDEWFASWDEYVAHVRNDRWAFKILTLEGTMEALPGDWIIRGTAGEHYPCKPEIFAGIYEPAGGDASEAAVDTLSYALTRDVNTDFEERISDTFIMPDTAAQALDWLTRLGAGDPQAAARISWPGLFPPTEDARLPAAPAPEELPLSEALLRATIAAIEERNSDLSRAGLIEELKAIEGASIEEVAVTCWTVHLHGIEVTGSLSAADALRTWCQKARRAIMNGRAV